VSFGVFDLGASAGGSLPDGAQVARLLGEAGYDGVDMGPAGYFGRGAALRELLGAHGLAMAGGWIDLPYRDDEEFERSWPSLVEAVDVMVEAAGLDAEFAPKPTLACSGSLQRKAYPGGGPGLGLDDAEWERYARNVTTAADYVRSRGLEPTFHHHACTYVETPEEIDEFLARTDVGLTLDTGHLLLGGGDPVAAISRWAGRINHVHLKDYDHAAIESVQRDGGDLRALWAGRAFVPLGEGDLDLDGFMAALLGSGYAGWLEIEQDTIPAPGQGPEVAGAEQARNRQTLRRWIP
jgi:inosose dehydratase